MNRWTMAILLVLALAGGLASAATLTVPTQYSTITEALAAAQPGDTILVTDVPSGETFPILVQIDNLTIQAQGNFTISGESSKAVFVVGAKKIYNPDTGEYEPVRVSGVTITGFQIQDGGIGILVKEADNVTIAGNRIVGSFEGIRLLDANSCWVTENQVRNCTGIGIFLEGSDENSFSGNVVENCGLGLLVFESSENVFEGDAFRNNGNGGVVLNDSEENSLTRLTVTGNTGWGVRFVFADKNSLTQSWITDNTWGGVELLGSQENLVEGNVVYNNGTPNDGSDDAQIVVTFGDKAIFTTDVFKEYGADFQEFVEAKHLILEKLWMLVGWVEDLDYELIELRQKLAEAIGMTQPPQPQTSSVVGFIRDSIMVEKHYIASNVPQTPSGVYGVLQRGFWKETSTHRPPKIEDLAENFTLEGTKHPLADDLDKYFEPQTPSFSLNRSGGDGQANTDDDEVSWDKLGIMRILILAIKNEIKNEIKDEKGKDIPDLWQRLNDLKAKGLITEGDFDDLEAKLNAAVGFAEQIVEKIEIIREKLEDPDEDDDVDNLLNLAITALEGSNPDWSRAREKLLAAKNQVELLILCKQELYILVMDIWYKLCLVDLELPRTPEVNSDLVGKKEKPFADITQTESNTIISQIVDKLNADNTAKKIHNPWVDGDISETRFALRASEKNVISSNLITTDLMSSDRNIGIVVECAHNVIVNNLITNEAVEPIDQEPHYGEFHRLDVAIVLLADENLIAYNAIEWVDNGIIRGGTWKRKDLQVEYVFAKLAGAAYWPEPGWPEPGNPANDRLCCVHPVTGMRTCYTADHFEWREVAWVPVLSVTSTKIDVGFETSQRVKRNRISLNFFEHVGVTIDILDAESNTIDENLFYLCANGIRFRAADEHPWYPKMDIGGAGSNIQLLENDFFGGVAVDNQTPNQVDASNNYAKNALVTRNVTPPAATAPFAFDNFLTITKFRILEDWVRQRMGLQVNLQRFRWDGLTPNLDFFYPGLVLPSEKPRHPQDIIREPGVPAQKTLSEGLHLLSVPVVPADASPANVFRGAVQGSELLVVAWWNGSGYVMPSEVDSGRGYWIYLWGPRTISVSGEFPASPYEVDLPWAGWHLVSTPKWPVAWTSVSFRLGSEEKSLAEAITAGWLIPFAYYWQQGTGYVYIPLSASTTEAIDPWVGYWIKTLVSNLTMIIPLDQPYFPPTPTAVPLSASTLPAHLQPPAPPAVNEILSGMLTVLSYPNPVSAGQVTFRALGLPVEQLRVTVLDVSGRKVWTAEAAGGQLAWTLMDNAGRAVANGVYLYYVEAKVGEVWIRTKLERILVLR